MTEEEIREQKQQLCQQYGITEKQIDAFAAACNKLWEAVKEIADNILAFFREHAENLRELMEANAAAFREAMQQADLSTLSEAIETIQGAITTPSPPSYSLASVKQYNAMQRQRLKSYKNRIGSAAIRRPKRIARSCC